MLHTNGKSLSGIPVFTVLGSLIFLLVIILRDEFPALLSIRTLRLFWLICRVHRTNDMIYIKCNHLQHFLSFAVNSLSHWLPIQFGYRLRQIHSLSFINQDHQLRVLDAHSHLHACIVELFFKILLFNNFFQKPYK